MSAKKKKPTTTQAELDNIEKEVRQAAPPHSMVIPVSLRSVYEVCFENFFAVFGRDGLYYLVGADGQTVEQQVYKALNMHHMVFNNRTLAELYNLYS